MKRRRRQRILASVEQCPGPPTLRGGSRPSYVDAFSCSSRSKSHAKFTDRTVMACPSSPHGQLFRGCQAFSPAVDVGCQRQIVFSQLLKDLFMCKEQGKVDYVKYTFSDYSVKTHYSSPWFINGDGSGTWINRLEFLSKVRCASTVTIRVKFYTWARGDKSPCGSFKLKLKTPSCYFV
jgi:hypothetical protein